MSHVLTRRAPPAPSFPTFDCWVRGEDLSSAGGIASWLDYSGHSRPLTQATGANQPTADLTAWNGGPCAVFDGVNDYFNLANFLNGQAAGEIFVLLQLDADPPGSINQTGLWYFGTQSDHYPYVEGTIYDDWGSDTRKTTGDPATALTTKHVYNVSSAAGAWTSRINGVQHYTTASNTVFFNTAPQFGASGGLSYFLQGKVREILIKAGSTLNSTDRTTVTDYLLAKI